MLFYSIAEFSAGLWEFLFEILAMVGLVDGTKRKEVTACWSAAIVTGTAR
jgi:hypothetical protein